MRVQAIDHVALLPLYLASGAAVLALFAGRFAKPCMMIELGASALAACWAAGGKDRATFAVGDWHSYVADDAAMGAAALFAGLSVLVAAVSGRQSGEYWFLLAVSAAGGITLAGARDLITLIVALETLTVPLYVLVTKPGRDGAEAGVTFLIASIASSATALMGAAFLYAAAGTVHLEGLATGLADADPALVAAGTALLLGGLAFKLAAAPLHAWAPLVLERAPLPIATYLASASKLGGAVAVVWVVYFGLAANAGASTGIVMAALSVASIVVGNLGALVQRRTVPLLAWSGIAHAGYALAPLAVVATAAGRGGTAAAASAALAYAVFFVLLEAGAFAALAAVRETGEGGSIAELSGLWRSAPLPASLFLFAVIGLAGLPPALAGTFAKVAVLEVLAPSAVWLAVIVAAGTILGLAYYLPLARTVLLGRGPATAKGRFAIALAAIGLALLAATLAPQLVLDFTAISR
ncbi:proton-conducting transporter membrane subunit [Glycomyces luteolus]|uniref:Proton-conducting transporter membrane subunit n=1 Tax=Glycomyces luteolus TaxID=2670330 RepID=A0A9X3T291_9ACTN|nr:proton-conducting transporter membrane subunit [Glycomyces luteolus]MDA1358525.1 proton-conducting transporter membrane subunit [Glycomyces luteolus]